MQQSSPEVIFSLCFIILGILLAAANVLDKQPQIADKRCFPAVTVPLQMLLRWHVGFYSENLKPLGETDDNIQLQRREIGCVREWTGFI
jgi:hypothetical protein